MYQIFEIAPDMYKIIEMSRWAPSADNSQPWTFQINDADHVTVHLTFERDNVYEYNHGQLAFLSGGALIETMRLVAASRGRACHITDAKMNDATDEYVMNLYMPIDHSVQVPALFHEITRRSVDRYAYRRTPLTPEMVIELEASLGPDFGIIWHRTWRDKWRSIRMNMLGTIIRTSIPEAYLVHAKIFDKMSMDSSTGIPATASGFSLLSGIIMMWALKSWKRVSFLNKFLGATLLARLELDIIPGLNSACFFTIYFKATSQTPPSSASLIEAGAVMQRFWLTVTKLGLKLQPSFAPLIFATYSEKKVAFTSAEKYVKQARTLLSCARAWWPVPLDHVFFCGRIGIPRPIKHPRARSTRQSMNHLLRVHTADY